MKKVISIIVIVLVLATTVACSKKNPDANKFKEEYESYNSVEASNGKKYRDVSISVNNPFIYTTADELLSMIDNKETFYVYFGDAMCPWCRSVIEKAIEKASEYDIKKIYYIKIWDDDHNEILRSKYELDETNKLSLVNKGTENYYKLLDKFSEVLPDYTLTTQKGKKVETGEKRIYAPEFIYVENGKAIKMETGISKSLQEEGDPYAKLTKDILKEESKSFDKLFQQK